MEEIKLEIDKVDIEILYMLFVQEVFSPMNSFTLKKIIENTDLKLSYYSIHRRINKKLIPIGYILEGYKDGNAKSFYLSELAIKYLKENILEKEDVYVLEEYEDEDENSENGLI